MGKKKQRIKIFAWDLGATKCAIALVEYHVTTGAYYILQSTRTKLTDHNSLEAMVDFLETDLGLKMKEADGIVIAAAGQYEAGVIHHTNPYPYPMNIGEIAEARGWKKFTVVHDYVPIACATFLTDDLSKTAMLTLNEGQPNKFGRRVAFGVGTGLGLKDGVLLPNDDFWLGENEAGHIGIPYPPHMTDDECKTHEAFMEFLKEDQKNLKRPTISFETVLSGRGFALCHQFASGSHETLSPERTAEIVKATQDHRTLSLFGWYLGLFVGTVQLLFMPTGGIWIMGGVILKHLNVFHRSTFTRGIELSPAYSSERSRFPLKVIVGPEYVFLGSAYYGIHRLL